MKINNYFLAVCICAGVVRSLMGDYAFAEPGCANSAHTQRLACEFDLRDDFFTSSAQCLDATNQDPVCFSDDTGLYRAMTFEMIVWRLRKDSH